MKKKKGFTGLPDLIIAGGIMIASFFFPYLGYRYQKVNYTKTGLDLMKGFSSEDGKVAMAASVPMIIAIILSVVILLVGLLSIKEAKSLFADNAIESFLTSDVYCMNKRQVRKSDSSFASLKVIYSFDYGKKVSRSPKYETKSAESNILK